MKNYKETQNSERFLLKQLTTSEKRLIIIRYVFQILYLNILFQRVLNQLMKKEWRLFKLSLMRKGLQLSKKSRKYWGMLTWMIKILKQLMLVGWNWYLRERDGNCSMDLSLRRQIREDSRRVFSKVADWLLYLNICPISFISLFKLDNRLIPNHLKLRKI